MRRRRLRYRASGSNGHLPGSVRVARDGQTSCALFGIAIPGLHRNANSEDIIEFWLAVALNWAPRPTDYVGVGVVLLRPGGLVFAKNLLILTPRASTPMPHVGLRICRRSLAGTLL